MQNTENYNLPIIEGTDVISKAPHNTSVQIIDENMKRIDDGVTTLGESVSTVVETVERELGEAIDTVNNTLAETKEDIETEVETTLASAVNTAPIVAGGSYLPDVSGNTDITTVSYHDPKIIPIAKARKAWTIARTASDTPGDYIAVVPFAPLAPGQIPRISLIKQGLYKIDITLTIEYSGQGDGECANFSLVKNGAIEGTSVTGVYLASNYVELNGDGRATVNVTGIVKNDTEGSIFVTPIAEIYGGTGAFNIMIADDTPINATVTKLN